MRDEPGPGPRRGRLRVVWALFGLLLAVIVLLEWRSRGDDGEEGEAVRPWNPVALEELSAVEVVDAAALHRFERDAQGNWFYHGVHPGAAGEHAHAPDAAGSERIARALLGTARARLEREVPLGPSRGADYGVTAPRTLVLFYRKGQAEPVAQYAVGDTAPDGASRYVSLVGGSSVTTLPGYQVDNLLNLVRSFTNPAPAAVPSAPARPLPLK